MIWHDTDRDSDGLCDGTTVLQRDHCARYPSAQLENSIDNFCQAPRFTLRLHASPLYNDKKGGMMRSICQSKVRYTNPVGAL